MRKKTSFTVRTDSTDAELRAARLFIDELLEQRSQPGYQRPKRRIRNVNCQTLDVLGLPKNLQGALIDANLSTIGDVMKESETTLLHRPGIGTRMVLQLKEALAELGLALKEDAPQ